MDVVLSPDQWSVIVHAAGLGWMFGLAFFVSWFGGRGFRA